MSFLTEAFQKLNLMESEDFSIDKKGVEKLKDFLDDDAELDVVTVIDPEVENPDELLGGVHVGMTILGCPVCNSLHYRNPEEIVINEESQLANLGECCPYCFSTDGFKIVGTVAPFEDVTVEVLDGDKDVEVKVDGEEVKPEHMNEDVASWLAAKKNTALKRKERKLDKKLADMEEPEEGASEEDKQAFADKKAKLADKKDEIADKADREKMKAKAGAREGSLTSRELAKAAKEGSVAGAEKGRATQAKNRAEKRAEARKALAADFGGEDKFSKLIADAGYVLKEDLGSWLAAKKLQKMSANGPKDGEDLTARKDKMDRLRMRAKAGAVKDTDNTKANATQKVLDKTLADTRKANLAKGRETQANNRNEVKRVAAVDELKRVMGCADEKSLERKLGTYGYVIESMMNEAPYLDNQFDTRKSFYNKARISNDGNTLYSYETKVMEIKDGKPCLTIGEDLLSMTTLRHIKEFLKQKGFKAETKAQILADYSCLGESCKGELKEAKKTVDDLTDDEIFDLVYAKLAEDGMQNTMDAEGNKTTPRLNKGVGFSKDDMKLKANSQGIDCIFISAGSREELAPAIEVANYYDCLYEVKKMKDYENDKPYGMFIDYGSADLEKLLADDGKPFASKKKGEDLEDSQRYPIESPLPDQTGLKKNGALDLADTKAGDPEDADILKESMEDISITTEDQVIKVKATPRTDKETIVPPAEETKEEEPEEEIMDAEIEEIDEEGVNELGESYLKRVYENVKSFKLVDGQVGDNKMILEGVITFKSGKKSKTSFILESKEITKRGRVRFVGMNESLSKNKNAYAITGKIVDKKLVLESFNYNYLGKDAKTGKSTKLYGTIKRRK